MTGSISAKVSPPVLSEILYRERPFSIIDGLFNRPILWVSGPPGSGKTTLVASYLNSRELPHLWYKVDVSDSDIATFFYYMGLALREFMRKNKWVNKKPLPLLTPEYLDGIHAFTRTYFEELYNNLCHSQKTKGKTKIIVLDDYHSVSDKARFHSIISEGLSLMPESIRVIIISRSDPPPIYTKFRAQRAISFIGWNDIRFTKDETADFLKSHGKKLIRGKGIEQIYEESNGWISGVILLSESDKVNKQEIFPTSLPSYEGVFDYFASELFDSFNSDTQEFLLRTSFLNHISPAVANRLSEIKNSEEILRGLYKNNRFTSRYFSDNFVYEYHPLFKRFLRNRAETLYGHDEVTKIKIKTAGILKEEGLCEEALSLLKESGHWSDFVRLLVSEAPVIASQGRTETLLNLLSDIPDEIIKDSPSCLYWMGISGMPFDTYKSRDLFERAFEGFVKLKDIDGALLSWAGVIETIFFERGDFSRMDKWINKFNELTANPIHFSSTEIEIAVIKGMIEIILSRTPYNKDSDRWVKRAIELIESDISPDSKLSIASPLHLYHVYTGDYITASAIFDSLQQTINPETLSPISTIRWHLIRAVHAHMVTVSIDNCLKSVDLGLEIAERTGIHLLDIPLYQTGAYASLIMGNCQRAEDYLKRMKPFIKPFSYFDIGNCNSIKLSIALMKKDYFAAFKEALNTLRMAFKTESPIPIFLTHIGMAQALISLGRLKMASEHIKKADLMILKIKKTETYFPNPEITII